MKEIKAIIQPFMLERVLDALRGIEDLPGLVVSELRVFRRTRGRVADAAADNPAEYVKMTKIELVVPDAHAEKVVRTIEESARTGNIGDGKILVYQVEEVIRIRTGERGDAAI